MSGPLQGSARQVGRGVPETADAGPVHPAPLEIAGPHGRLLVQLAFVRPGALGEGLRGLGAVHALQILLGELADLQSAPGTLHGDTFGRGPALALSVGHTADRLGLLRVAGTGPAA